MAFRNGVPRGRGYKHVLRTRYTLHLHVYRRASENATALEPRVAGAVCDVAEVVRGATGARSAVP